MVEGDPLTGNVKARFDLNAIDGTGEGLGWCRGFCLHDGVAYVGFTRIRHTRLRRNLSWLRNRGQVLERYRSPPTRIVAYDLRRCRKLQQWVTEDRGLDTVFSILPIRTTAGGETVPA